MRSKSICGNVAGLKAVAADCDDVVVVVQIGSGQVEHCLGLERLHKG